MEKIKAGTLNICGWYFDFENGDLSAYDGEKIRFERIASTTAIRPSTSTKESLSDN